MPTQSEKYIVKKSKKKKNDTKMTYLDCLKKNFFLKIPQTLKSSWTVLQLWLCSVHRVCAAIYRCT